MRRARRPGILAGLLLALVCTPAFAAEPVIVSATPVTSFKGAAIGQPVDGLVFRGGLVFSGDHSDFGGLSGITFIDAERFVMVTDEGQFVSGRMALSNGAPSGLDDVEIEPIRNSAGDPLPTRFSRDAEAIETIMRDGRAVGVRVGFENLARIADFNLIDGRATGAARPVAIPDWVSAVRTNESIESVCIAPPASPVAGSTLIVLEGHSRQPGTWAATLLGNRDRGDLHLQRANGFNPTGCAFLPNGDLLVLERGLSFLSFSMQLRRIPARDVRAGAIMDGDVLISASGTAVDNMEGLAVRRLANGEIRITIVSDDNFNSFQRNLLLEFALP